MSKRKKTLTCSPDGSAHFVTDDIGAAVRQAMGSIADAEILERSNMIVGNYLNGDSEKVFYRKGHDISN